MAMEVKRGEIYWVTIAPSETRGSEQYGRRPFLVVSREAVNRAGKTVVVVPFSTNIANQPAFRVVVPVEEIAKDASCNSALATSVAKTDQVRVVDKSRLEQRIGTLSQTAIIAVAAGLGFVFDIR